MPDTTGQNSHNNRLLAALPPDAREVLDRDLKQVSFAQGTVLIEPGEPVERIYFPQHGLISLLVVTKDGGAVEAATIGREGAVGLHGGLGLRRSFTRANVQIPGTVSVVAASRFEHIARDSAPVRDLIARYTEVLWAETQQIAACNAVHDASSRICRWLLQSADRIDSDKLPLTQEFLAQMLGVRRTTVTLLAQSLQQKGLIHYGRGSIDILDRKGLEACACECYHVIHHRTLPSTLGVNL